MCAHAHTHKMGIAEGKDDIRLVNQVKLTKIFIELLVWEKEKMISKTDIMWKHWRTYIT